MVLQHFEQLSVTERFKELPPQIRNVLQKNFNRQRVEEQKSITPFSAKHFFLLSDKEKWSAENGVMFFSLMVQKL